jgi:hypothetical protein
MPGRKIIPHDWIVGESLRRVDRPTFSLGRPERYVNYREALKCGATEAELVQDADALKGSALWMGAPELWMEVPVGKQWLAACRILPQDGVPVIVELRLYPQNPRNTPGRWAGELAGPRATFPAGGISTKLLRDVRLGLSARAWAYFNEYLRRMPKTVAEQLARAAQTDVHAGARRRTGRPDRFYARVAQRYVRLVMKGSRRPNEQIAAQIEESISKVRDFITQARRRGLLTQAPKMGQRGGSLTQRALKLLKTRGDEQ